MRLLPLLLGVSAYELFVVPHSHCDPGWLKPFDNYYNNYVRFILGNVITLLKENPDRRFVWSEM